MDMPDILDRFPREMLTHGPTLIEPMQRLGAHVGGPKLLVKRDDCTGFAMGGNKVRQLEYIFGDAKASGADAIVITGAVQSNYMRTAAAAAARLGMECHLQMEDRVRDMDPSYHSGGNVLLDRMFGAQLHFYPEGEDETGADKGSEEIAANLRTAGKSPYIIQLSADHKPLGALGYMRCAAEIVDQLEQSSQQVDAIVTGSGSAVTHAGILTGLRLVGSKIPVHGICVRRDSGQQTDRVQRVCALAQEMIDCPGLVDPGEVLCHDDWFAGSYGVMDETTIEAMSLAGRMEGLVTDPVYTAKAMAGLIGLARSGKFTPDQTLLLIHTGGQPALFAYTEKVTAALSNHLN